VAAYPLRRPLIEAARRLRLVHHQGVGYQDTVDAAALAARGVALALTPEGTTVGVAEHAVLLVLAVCRRLAFADSELRAGRWHVNSLRPHSRELFGRTVGYVGMGRIAQAVAERLRAFGTRGVYADPVALPPAREAELDVRRASLDETLREADVVTLHVPLTAETRHLIGREAIARMKPGAVLVNTARGGVVDEVALHDALAAGRLGGAGLDVFEREPPPADHPLFRLPTVVVTPHIAAGTRDALAAKMAAVFANVERFYAGEPLRNRVDLGGRP
jgi:phosphoglycerate dehydrogenase-like enzyme